MARTKSLRIRQKRSRKFLKMEPGCQPQFEDSKYIHNRSNLRSQPDRTPAPRLKGKERVSRTDVRERLMTAMKTLRALPDREKRFFVVKSTSPDYVREYIDAYNSADDIVIEYRPTPADVSDCLTALAWARHLDKRMWQILWWRSFGLSFGLIGKYIGRTDETARKRFEEALTDTWIAANGV